MPIQSRSLRQLVGLPVFFLTLVLTLLQVEQLASQRPGPGGPGWDLAYIPMKDGTKLAVILRKPEVLERYPVLVTYDGHLGGATILGPEEKEYLRHGYGLLGASVRGTGASEGVFAPFSRQEGEDGKTIIEWAGQQPWCDGNVGMYGNFYAGVTQLAVASQRPKFLKALATGAIWGDSYEEIGYPGGIFNFGLVSQWSYQTQPFLSGRSARLREFVGDSDGARRRALHPTNGKSYEEMRSHPLQDAWWAGRNFEDLAAQIETPTLIFHGWQDPQVSARGALRVFEKLPASKRILLSNGGDSTCGVMPSITERVRWFDRWLKGKPNGVDKEPPVNIWFETREAKPAGSNKKSAAMENRQAIAAPVRAPAFAKPAWVSAFSAWPIPQVQWSTFYLTADARLAPEKAVLEKASGQRSYLYPAGSEIASTNELFSALPAALGSLAYRTSSLPEDMAIIGSPVLTLSMSCEQKDTDFMAVLHDVSPKGEVTYVQRGLLRASHRALDAKKSTLHDPIHPHDTAVALTPGQVYEVKFSLFPVGHVVRRGHVLELVLLAPPPSPAPIWAFLPLLPGVNTVYHSLTSPSTLELPIVATITAQAPEPPFGSLPLQPAREQSSISWQNERKILDDLFRSWKKENSTQR